MVKYTNIQCIKSITVARVTFTVPVRVNKTNIGYMKSVCLKMCINTTEKLVLYKTYKVSENKINYEKALYRKRSKMEN